MMAEPPGVLSRSGDAGARPSWEVIRIGRYYGLQALTRLNAPGSVAVDPERPAVYFFVAIGATATWPSMPAHVPLAVTTGADLPPVGRRTPPGAYWLVPPRRGTLRLIDAGTLHTALADLLPEWTGEQA